MEWLAWWPAFAGVAAVVVAVVGVAHAVLNKREVRAAIGWAGLIVLSPFLGAGAYALLGINRIKRRAARLAAERPTIKGRQRGLAGLLDVAESIAPETSYLRPLGEAVGRITGLPLVAGNRVQPLVDGDEAYPAMLGAIAAAERNVLLMSYIFDNDAIGKRFVEALGAAVDRGVEVRVLIDGVGARYSRPSILGALRDCGVPASLFLPPRLPLHHSYMNLRNHRKLLIVDRRVAFAGGLNLRAGCVLADDPDDAIQDVHFQLEGPVVHQLFAMAADDWRFATDNALDGAAWKVEELAGNAGAVDAPGTTLARTIPDGPDEDFENLRWTFMAALGAARESVWIATPYFLPEAPLLAALRLAALRGVEVNLLLPARNNLLLVQWASTAQLWQVLEPGCRVWLVPPPFDHSKVFVVDNAWSLIGSANWDPRSLRLNFEVGVECYDGGLAEHLVRLLEGKRRQSRELTLDEIDGLPLPVRLRNGLARLVAPYL